MTYVTFTGYIIIQYREGYRTDDIIQYDSSMFVTIQIS